MWLGTILTPNEMEIIAACPVYSNKCKSLLMSWINDIFDFYQCKLKKKLKVKMYS